MITDSYFFSFYKNRIHVSRYGRGERLLIVFHGFSESGELYGNLGTLLGDEFTTLVPDMPYHGKTKWDTGILSPKRLIELVRILLKKEGSSSCSILGYSMGGRPALSLTQEDPGFIDHLLLLAPEGLRKNHWFRFATGTILGNLLFRWVAYKPGFLFFLVRIGRILGWIGKRMAAFIKDHMDDKERRWKVYCLWMCFQNLRPDRKRLYSAISRNNLPVWICFGKYDQLIPAEIATKLKPLPQMKVTIVESGHQLLQQKQVLSDICNYLCPPERT